MDVTCGLLCWITVILVLMQVGLKSFVVSVDYRVYMGSSMAVWSLRWLLLYLCSYKLVGSVTSCADDTFELDKVGMNMTVKENYGNPNHFTLCHSCLSYIRGIFRTIYLISRMKWINILSWDFSYKLISSISVVWLLKPHPIYFSVAAMPSRAIVPLFDVAIISDMDRFSTVFSLIIRVTRDTNYSLVQIAHNGY